MRPAPALTTVLHGETLATDAVARTQQALTTRGGRTLGSQRLMRGLVVAEIALALVTLIGAGVSAESFYRLSGVELGFDPSHVLTFRVSLASERHRTPDSRVRFLHELRERLRGTPDVLATGAVRRAAVPRHRA